MISLDDFLTTVNAQLNIQIVHDEEIDEDEQGQYNAISADPNQLLFIVAGPGSGKTTVMTLRVLKLIFVNDIDPKSILVTTFTRKAAAELSSRILGWGDLIRRNILEDTDDSALRDQLTAIDFNQITIDTLDSIAEQILRIYREPGNPAPIIIKEFTSKAIITKVLFHDQRYKNLDLISYINYLTGNAPTKQVNFSDLVKRILSIHQRCCHDQVQFDEYIESSEQPGVPILHRILQDYQAVLNDRNLFDFTRLETELYSRMMDHKLDRFLEGIRIVIIDEYQDTNFLQTKIYFKIAEAALQNDGSISVVGDDDQSIYRFRGATVELYREFQNHFEHKFHKRPALITLRQNFRSTDEIVNFINGFIQLDSIFQDVRVPEKPQIIRARDTTHADYYNYPVVGMFRNDINTLSSDLASFVNNLYSGNPITIPGDNGENHTIQLNNDGSAADIAILCISPKERKDMGNAPRLPFLLRGDLNRLNPGLKVFNPTGRKLSQIPEIEQLCGLILECIDPGSTIQTSIKNLPGTARATFDRWRLSAKNFIQINTTPVRGLLLSDFVNLWQNRLKRKNRQPIKNQYVSLIDLSYNLLTWLPFLQRDIEGLAYFEAILRTMDDNILFSSYESEILVDSHIPFNTHQKASINQAYWNIFVPIAMGAIEIDEELFETLPHDRLNIMSIHQAKGLEFPIVIVDVGSEFNKRYPSQTFKRYPSDPSFDTIMENEVRPFSPLTTDLGLDYSNREDINRDFDDLIRKFFVAYSRPKDILLLVGLNSVITDTVVGKGKNMEHRRIENIATGWTRTGIWVWRPGLNNLTHI